MGTGQPRQFPEEVDEEHTGFYVGCVGRAVDGQGNGACIRSSLHISSNEGKARRRERGCRPTASGSEDYMRSNRAREELSGGTELPVPLSRCATNTQALQRGSYRQRHAAEETSIS